MVKYFSKTYGEARWLFKEAALEMSKKYKYAEYRTVRIQSRTDQDLTIDTFYLPAQVKPERIILFASGVHGVEGMTGSAIELLCMKEDVITSHVDKATTGILFIHGINPYGQKYHRKVTENNVDLGRNFILAESPLASSPLSEGEKRLSYASMSAYLNPGKKYSHNLFENLVFSIRALSLLAKHTMPEVRQGILEGQYEFEKGIFYGGRQHEPQIKIISELLTEYLGRYNKILALDLHTGYGVPGELHFFLPYGKHIDTPVHTLDSVFEGYTIECRKPDSGFADSYVVKGTFLEFVDGFAKGKMYIPMVLKFGTIDNRKLSRQVLSLARIVHENQCIQYGYKTERDKKLIQKNFRNIYFPESEPWRADVLAQSKEVLPILAARFQKL